MKPIVVTNFLLAILAAILLFKFHPHTAWMLVGFAVMLGVGYVIWYVLFQAPGKIRKARALAKQHQDDQVLYDRFMFEHTAIRKKYDPDHKWNEATSTPREYRQEMAELNQRYKDVPARRFGGHIIQEE